MCMSEYVVVRASGWRRSLTLCVVLNILSWGLFWGVCLTQGFDPLIGALVLVSSFIFLVVYRSSVRIYSNRICLRYSFRQKIVEWVDVSSVEILTSRFGSRIALVGGRGVVKFPRLFASYSQNTSGVRSDLRRLIQARDELVNR